MNTRVISIPILALLIGAVGCYSLPKQRGTWEGEIGTIALYDAEKRECVCVALEITNGPALKQYVPKRVVLVKRNLQTYSTNELSGKKFRVTGQIASEYPICASTGKMLLGYRPNPQGDMPGIYVLKVSKVESF